MATRRKYKSSLDPDSDTIAKLPEVLGALHKAKRASKENGWRCPYCGGKFVNRVHFKKFTLEDHLNLTTQCRKDHEKTQFERLERETRAIAESIAANQRV